MIHKIKVLGLSMVGVLAMSAVVASAASATTFTAAEYPVTVKGAQSTQHVFTAAGGTVKCTTAKFAGEAGAASETLTIHPTYTGCTAFTFINSEITGFKSNECDYLFHAGAKLANGNFDGTVDLVCQENPETKKPYEVTIDAGPCVAHLPAQKGLATLEYKNEPGGKVTVIANVSGISGVMTSGVGCPATNGPFNNGTYTGNTLVEGLNGLGGADAIDVG